ncbi:MAG: lipopolysaccharide biosynthesis protein [Lachnospiraceae bacterium]|nr:lipopolysaccharide biosynthesis protein [Lachnospiraceae bacterium]
MTNSESNEISIENKTENSTRWSLITETAAKLIAPIVSMILARLLTPEAFGVIASVNMIVSFADVFSDAGFQKYLIQHDFKDKKEFYLYTDVAFWTNLAISIFAWLIIAIFSEPLANLVGNPGLGNVVCIAALSLPLTSFSSIQMAHYRKTFDFKTLFYVRIISACVPLVVTVPLAFITRSYWAMVIGTLASNIVNAILLTARSKWKPHFHYSFKVLKVMFSYSWWILIESISVWLTSYIGTFIVGLFLTTTEVGYYKTGMSTVNQIITLISVSISNPLFSALSALKNDEERFESVYYKYIRAVGTFMIPLAVGFLLFLGLACRR